MEITLKTQVIIIGAGPAGAATSIFLSQAGISHIILEKETFPRDKVCGDGCSGKTTYVLQQANPEWLAEIIQRENIFSPSHGITLVAPNGKILNVPFQADSTLTSATLGFTVPRLQFDHFLFQKLPSSYCTIFQKVAVKTICRQTDGSIKVNFLYENEMHELTAPLIVGADGDKSVVRKSFFNGANSPKSDVVALRSYYKGITGFEKDRFIEIHFLKEVLPGYLWIFPLANGMANVGVGMPSKWIRKKNINLRELLQSTIQNHPGLKHRFRNATLVGKIQGWGLPTYTKRQPLSGSNFLLTGDAAFLIDPLTGEGIGNALYSGMTAATAIEKAFAANQFDAHFFKAHYDRPLFKGIGKELRISAALQRLYYFPGVLSFLANKVYEKPSRIDTISKMLVDVELRKKLQQPSFYAKLLLR